MKLERIAIILDGNRRLAKRLMMQPWKGHELGARKVEKLLEWCRELGITEITMYALSLDNFSKRPKEEIEYLYGIFRKEFDNLMQDERIHKQKVKISFIGRRHILPEDLQESMNKLEEMTKGYDKYYVNFALAYGGREEIIDAIKNVAYDVKKGIISEQEIDKKKFREYLDLQSDPQLIIRTGGEFRTSNYLVWQSAYSEWLILDKFWPDFEKEDLIKAKQDFENRDIRLGK